MIAPINRSVEMGHIWGHYMNIVYTKYQNIPILSAAEWAFLFPNNPIINYIDNTPLNYKVNGSHNFKCDTKYSINPWLDKPICINTTSFVKQITNNINNVYSLPDVVIAPRYSLYKPDKNLLLSQWQTIIKSLEKGCTIGLVGHEHEMQYILPLLNDYKVVKSIGLQNSFEWFTKCKNVIANDSGNGLMASWCNAKLSIFHNRKYIERGFKISYLANPNLVQCMSVL